MIMSLIHTLDANKDTQADWPKCPGCGRPLMSYQKRNSINERFKLNTREIFGYCLKCGSVQIEQALFTTPNEIASHLTGQTPNIENWKITKYRFFVLKPQAWQKVNDLPVPIVLTES